MSSVKINYSKINSLQLLTGAGSGDVYLEGSKSITNRALILSAQAKHTVKIFNYSPSADSLALIDGLERLGVVFKLNDNYLEVTPPSKLEPFQGEINVGPAGTSMRFLTALIASIKGSSVTISGTERMHARPIYDLVSALNQAGANIQYLEKPNCPPLLIKGHDLEVRELAISGNTSSQFLTSLLLLAPSLKSDLRIKITDNLVSRSYVDLTLHTLQQFGIYVEEVNANEFIIPGNSKISCKEYLVEGDASGASYIWGMAALSGNYIKVFNISKNSKQGDAKFVEVLREMGCRVDYGDNFIGVHGSEQLKGIQVDFQNMPDCAQTLAVIASIASSQTTITGLSTLKNKETDRLKALQIELEKIGVKTEINEQSITIYPAELNQSVVIDTYDDHRMAMSFAMLAGRINELSINYPGVVEKSFPTFWQKVNTLGVKTVLKPNDRIILTGFMGAGKTTVAKLLAEKLALPFIDLDREIIKLTSYSTIPQIFEILGEVEFRNLETKALKNSIQTQKFVLATGGGVFTRVENIQLIKEANVLNVYLATAWETVLERLQANSEKGSSELASRPLLKDLAKAKELYDQRQIVYQELAQISVDTNIISIEVVAKSILESLY